LSYEVRFASAAARDFRKLPAPAQASIRKALRKTAEQSARGAPGSRGGKSLKVIQGRRDRFFRLRVGDNRVMFDLIDDDRVLLVLGIVHRRDLERWLRGR
jgi:mRNA-degrading endonuclease RelE of RelBE toxin-antitoxin system